MTLAKPRRRPGCAHRRVAALCVSFTACSESSPSSCAGDDGGGGGASTSAAASDAGDGDGSGPGSDGEGTAASSAGADGSSGGEDTGGPNNTHATYPLEIIAPQPGLDLNSRWYRAYPGLAYRVPVGVFGGAYPFVYSLAEHPEGMTIDAHSGVIDWLDPGDAGQAHAVTVEVEADTMHKLKSVGSLLSSAMGGLMSLFGMYKGILAPLLARRREKDGDAGKGKDKDKDKGGDDGKGKPAAGDAQPTASADASQLPEPPLQPKSPPSA